MTILQKIDSNQTGLRFCVETSIGVLPAAASQIWYPLEPNSYQNFGGQTKLTQRSPITNTRQKRKGVLTDLDASGSINMDMTLTNYQRLMEGFMFANFREKFDTQSYNGTNATATSVATPSTFNLSNGTQLANLHAGFLIWTSGFTNTANNGLFVVSSLGASDIVVTAASLVAEASPPAAARIEAVGVQFTTGDATITNSGTAYPTLNTTTFDLTTLDLIPGEFVFIGGDGAGTEFATATNNGFCRVRSVSAHAITLDKTTGEMVTDAGAGKTIQMFFGRVVKNEANNDGANGSIPIVRTTYQFERTLGAPDLSNPTEVQAEYLVGSVPSKFKMNLKTADKVTSDLEFVSLTVNQRTNSQQPLSVQSGATAPTLVSEDAFNTTSHIARMRLAVLSNTDASPTALIGFIDSFDFTIDNMLRPNKAIGVLGAFEVTAGHFMVDGTMKVYFSTVAAQQEILANGNITLDIAFVNENKGAVVDMPLIALSDGRPDVVSDEPVFLPLKVDLAPDPTFNHELCWIFFNYLPSAAQPVV